MLDATGLVHMFRVPQQRDDKTGPLAEPDHGRIYDPLLGRFLSADPHVQSPQDLQSYNRYTYVNNNPVSFTDSTGFFIDKLFKKVGNFFKKFWKQIVVIVVVVVVAYFTMGAALAFFGPSASGGLGLTGWALGAAAGAVSGAAAGFVGGFLGSMLSGGSLGSALSAGLTGAMWGALSGAAAGGIGGHIGSNTQGFWTEVKRAAAHGLSSGVIDEVRGGAFLAGFAAGFFASAATHGLGVADMGFVSGGVMAAAIGGTAAVIGGGKFENGAMYGAFQFMFNAKQAELRAKKSIPERLREEAESGGTFRVGIHSSWDEGRHGDLEGHAWLSIEGRDVTTTLGLWSDLKRNNGLLNSDVHWGGEMRDDGTFRTGTASYYFEVDAAGMLAILESASNYVQWSGVINCTSWTVGISDKLTGKFSRIETSYVPSGPYGWEVMHVSPQTPMALNRWINELNKQ